MTYLVKLDHFVGPLDLLLQLIEREELSITEISLSRVTDDYLNIIRNLKEIQPTELADFLVIAAKLILIKSQALLPDIKIEYEEESLVNQLRLYKVFQDASIMIDKMLKAKRFMFPREKVVAAGTPIFSPPRGLVKDDLVVVLRRILKSIELLRRLPKAAIERAMSIQEKIEHIRKTILSQATFKFGEILKSAKSKTEVIVSFLALLELIKERVVSAKQESLFKEINLERQINN